MRLDATLRGIAPEQVADFASTCEQAGFDRLLSTETNNDPFLALVLAATVTTRIELGTGVALALPRNPMQLAYTGWDLQRLTGGRFVLGLGSQVRAHIERRFGTQWEGPARRIRDFVLAMRSIWSSWAEGTSLHYEGEFYRHTLMPPDFRPAPHGHRVPPIILAGVQTRMIELAGEVADGLIVHPLHTPRFLREAVLPALERGLQRSGRDGQRLELTVCLLTACSEEESEAVRRRIAFYASTPGYREVLKAHGWSELCDELHRLSRSGGWDRMSALVPDELLDIVAVRAADAAGLASEITRRYTGLAGRVNLHAGARSDLQAWAELATALRARERQSCPEVSPPTDQT